VQDFSYDCWVIDQLSEGVVPLFLPAVLTEYQVVSDSFANVAAAVAAARAQLSVAPETYPLSGPDVLYTNPEWFDQRRGYETTENLDVALTVQETGDVAHRNPIIPTDDPTPAPAVARADSTAYSFGQLVLIGTQTYEVREPGTSDASAPSTAGVSIGDELVDGTVTYVRVN
jgi:hypothetical protein